jgi:hypothetical protein
LTSDAWLLRLRTFHGISGYGVNSLAPIRTVTIYFLEGRILPASAIMRTQADVAEEHIFTKTYGLRSRSFIMRLQGTSMSGQEWMDLLRMWHHFAK